jgi:RNA polymerase primary sigma factor
MAVAKRADQGEDKVLKTYLEEINRIPVLTREQEVELTQRMKGGDQEALNELVRHNLRYVASVAKNYRGHSVSLSDLISEGNIGLIKAAERFDPSRNVKFITYAVWWIRQSILMALSKQSGIVRMPIKRMGVLNRIEAKNRELSQKKGRKLDYHELADELDMSVEEIFATRMGYSPHVSLDAPVTDDSSSPHLDMLKSEDDTSIEDKLVNESLAAEVRDVINGLNPREREIILMRYGFQGEPMTLEQIGARMALSKERIRQIEIKALNKLKTKYGARQLHG